MEVQLRAPLGNCDIPTDRPTERRATNKGLYVFSGAFQGKELY